MLRWESADLRVAMTTREVESWMVCVYVRYEREWKEMGDCVGLRVYVYTATMIIRVWIMDVGREKIIYVFRRWTYDAVCTVCTNG